MNMVNQIILDSIVEKAEKICPDSLALIGIYGSVASGDEYAKSDLDLLILIKDDNGWKLGCGFILDDTNIGYDIYCTNWEGLQRDAQCNHAHLSKLLDSKIVYVNDPKAAERLERIREETKALLASEERYEKANGALKNAKLSYAEACLSDDISKVRTAASNVIGYLFDAIMLFNGKYFKLGVKRRFDELNGLGLLPCFKENINMVVTSEEISDIRVALRSLVNYIEKYIKVEREKQVPSADNISGTYEEMFSNWRNKVEEAAQNNNHFSSFMNLCSLQKIIHEISEEIEMEDFEIMHNYSPGNLTQNINVYDNALNQYKKLYDRAGIEPKHFANVNAFIHEYLS